MSTPESVPTEKMNKRKRVRLEKFTTRMSLTGDPYPRCQFSSFAGQCEKATYADGLCYQHFQERPQ